MSILTAFVCVWLLAAVCAAVCLIAFKVARRDGIEEGVTEERSRWVERRAARRAAEGRDEDDFAQWLREMKRPGEAEFERLAATGEIAQLAADPRPARRRLTDTGAIRAFTDAYLERMAAGEEEYRRGTSTL